MKKQRRKRRLSDISPFTVCLLVRPFLWLLVQQLLVTSPCGPPGPRGDVSIHPSQVGQLPAAASPVSLPVSEEGHLFVVPFLSLNPPQALKVSLPSHLPHWHAVLRPGKINLSLPAPFWKSRHRCSQTKHVLLPKGSLTGSTALAKYICSNSGSLILPEQG